MEIKTEKVKLSKVLPNEDNPRADFGDLDALADSIRATGGEPVNPIVCVRDANALFIVDGERRYRAMRKLYGDEDPEITVAVLPKRSDAAEIIAMLATDDKKLLTEAEKSKGYQLAFDLGINYVNDTELAMATGRKTDDVMRARLVWGDFKKAEREKYTQCTLDQLAAAQEFEGKDRDAILKCKPEQVAMKAITIRAKKRKREVYEKVADMCATLGLELVEHKGTDRYEPGEGKAVLESWTRIADVSGADQIEQKAKETGATACVHADNFWHFEYALVGDAKEQPEHVPTQEEVDRERARSIIVSLKERICEFADLKDVPAITKAYARNGREVYGVNRIVEGMMAHGIGEQSARERLDETASFYELRYCLSYLNTYPHNAAKWIGWLYQAAIKDGFEPTEDEAWLVEYLSKSGED